MKGMRACLVALLPVIVVGCGADGAPTPPPPREDAAAAAPQTAPAEIPTDEIAVTPAQTAAETPPDEGPGLTDADLSRPVDPAETTAEF